MRLQAGPIPLFIPNTRSRVRAVRVHDVHHVVTGYATTFAGEAEIGAWEIASGCADHGAAWVLNILALRYLQLDQTVSILFSTPFFVTLLSGFVLGEWAGWRRWTAIAIGFSGVLLIARPGMGGMHPAALLCLGGAICYSIYNISTRVLARTDSNETTLFYSNFVGTVAALPALPFVWTTPHEPVVIVLMVLIGAFGSLGHYLLIAAHRLASASVLAPFIYSQLVWAITAGYLVFGQLPSEWTLAGAAIVIASGLYILFREHKLRG